MTRLFYDNSIENLFEQRKKNIVSRLDAYSEINDEKINSIAETLSNENKLDLIEIDWDESKIIKDIFMREVPIDRSRGEMSISGLKK